MATPEPADLDRRRWSTRRPATTAGDVADLYEAEQRLDQVEHEMEDLAHQSEQAEDAYAQALCAWEAHLAYWTLQLDADGARTSEDLRRATAIANVSKAGVPGERLYFEMIAAKSVLNSVTRSITVWSNRTSPLQTRINGLRKATGADQ